MPYGSGPQILVEVGSDGATCPMALDLASRLGRTPMLPRIPRLYDGNVFEA
jgi:hypothetical protein